jgi:hypothetical protein
MSRFGKPIHLIVDYSMKGLVTRFFTNLGRIEGWKNPRTSAWSRNFNWLNIYSWTTWDFQGRNNRCYKCNLWRSKNCFEKYYKSNEQWRVICMKEEFHARFAIILQLFYQREWLMYFSNKIAITLDLTNKRQLMNWCSMILT